MLFIQALATTPGVKESALVELAGAALLELASLEASSVFAWVLAFPSLWPFGSFAESPIY